MDLAVSDPGAALVADLRRELTGNDRVVDDPALLASHRRDSADLCHDGTAVALVRPRHTAEVSTAVRIAARHGIPVVPQGALTGLAGGANAVDGALLVSTTAMRSIIEIDPTNRFAVVQPGVITADLRRAAAEVGLAYPPDPGSFESSTIGGNVATNAGGMCCVKYGVTSEYVLGLEVVLADGQVLRTGRRTAKGVAGYDLTRLFTGSEGTLGIITEITVRLVPRPDPALTAVAVFPSIAAAGAAVTAITDAGCTPSLLELLDRTYLRAIEAYRPMGLDTEAAALLLIAADAPAPTAAAQLQVMAELCRQSAATEVYVATDGEEADALMAARRLAHDAMERHAARLYPAGGLISEDIAVPRSLLVELIEGIERIAAEHQVTVGVFGHAGDGNLHPNIVVDRSDPESLRRGTAVFDAIMQLGLALGGTCTGEHGVGLLKRDWFGKEVGPVGLQVHAAIKNALDPHGLFNPGKVLPAGLTSPAENSTMG